jgi:hypothetical protein
VTSAHVLSWACSIGASSREPSSATVGAQIACLSSYYRFLVRMSITTGNPCDAVERPPTGPHDMSLPKPAADRRRSDNPGDRQIRESLAVLDGGQPAAPPPQLT